MSDILFPVSSGGTDLDPVTATAADVRKGKVIVDKNGNPLTGTMAEKAAATITPGRANQTIAANQYLAGAQTIKGDANLLAANILYGKSIFGVAGNVRKYGYYSRTLNTVGSKSFSLYGGGSANMPYLLFSPGFIPQICIAQKSGEATMSISTPWNHIMVKYQSWDAGYNVSDAGIMKATDMAYPVWSSGSYALWAAGYC